jgi:hypothetical protein
VLPVCAIVFEEEATFADVSLSAVNPLIWEEAVDALATAPVSSTVETPTIGEAEFGFLRKAIEKMSLLTDLDAAMVIVAT